MPDIIPGFPSKHLIDLSGALHWFADFVKKLESIVNQLESLSVPAFKYKIFGIYLA